MNHYPAPQLDSATIEQIRRIAASGVSQDELIASMRAAGLSIVPSIRLLSELAGLSINDAKQAVHFSTTWSDCLTSNDAIHESAFKAAKEFDLEGTASDDVLKSRNTYASSSR